MSWDTRSDAEWRGEGIHTLSRSRAKRAQLGPSLPEPRAYASTLGMAESCACPLCAPCAGEPRVTVSGEECSLDLCEPCHQDHSRAALDAAERDA